MPVRLLSASLIGLSLLTACDGAPPAEPPPAAEPPAAEVKPPEAPAAADPLRPLDKPESVLIDGDRMWISVIGGSPADQNDDGRIMTAELACARAQGVAACLKATGIDGAKDEVKLDGPKGMARIGDWLYVADIDKVRRFNAADGKQGDDIALAGATFVNDLVADGAGGLWVSDSGLKFTDTGAEPTGSAAIWRIDAAGVATKVASGPGLGLPNGVTTQGEGVLVGRFDDEGGEGRIVSVSASGEIKPWASVPKGGLDGLGWLPSGELVVSSWGAESVFVLGADGALKATVPAHKGPADLAVDAEGQLIWIPAFMDGGVTNLPFAKLTTPG